MHEDHAGLDQPCIRKRDRKKDGELASIWHSRSQCYTRSSDPTSSPWFSPWVQMAATGLRSAAKLPPARSSLVTQRLPMIPSHPWCPRGGCPGASLVQGWDNYRYGRIMVAHCVYHGQTPRRFCQNSGRVPDKTVCPDQPQTLRVERVTAPIAAMLSLLLVSVANEETALRPRSTLRDGTGPAWVSSSH